MPNNPSESQIIKMWQHQLLNSRVLVTEEGEPIEIIYPGRINDDQGADFRDAVIATSQGLMKGDIEVHVSSSDWQGHRHHQNVAYNRVILHVTMWNNTKVTTSLQNGREVPILALDKYLRIPVSQWSKVASSSASLNVPCLKVTQRLTPDTMAGFLNRAGEERFLARSARLQSDLAQMAASQSLYQGIMGALGYSKNKRPFLELAGRLPLQVLESITQGKISDEECLAQQQALLLGTAGLLPSQGQDRHRENRFDDSWIDKLERLWTSSLHSQAMSPNDWHLFKVRPNNCPVRRLVAMSYLIIRYQPEGILDAIVNIIKEIPSNQGHRRLEERLLVSASGYWASHFDFGSGSRISSPTLLGSERAADIAVNVLLPFTVAWSRFTGQPELERQAFDLYHGYPRLAENSIERHMKQQLGLNSSLVNSARRQQGLIHIYRSRCTQGECKHCLLGQPEAGDNVQI